MELQVTKETIIRVDSFNLQEFIAQAYGVDSFEILETPNDSTHRFDISKDQTGDKIFEEYDKPDIQETIADESPSVEYYSLGKFLEDLAQKGLIERGIYLMDVCW